MAKSTTTRKERKRGNKPANGVYVPYEVAVKSQALGATDVLFVLLMYKRSGAKKGGKVPKRGCPHNKEFRRAVGLGWCGEDKDFWFMRTMRQIAALYDSPKSASIRVPEAFFTNREAHRALPYWLVLAYKLRIHPGTDCKEKRGKPKLQDGRDANCVAHEIMEEALGISAATSSRRRRDCEVLMVAAFTRRWCTTLETGHFRSKDGPMVTELPSGCKILVPAKFRFDPKCVGKPYSASGMRYGDLNCP